jgi:hypothetical protein
MVFQVRFIPGWFPFAHSQRQGGKWRETLNSISDVPHDWVKTQIVGDHLRTQVRVYSKKFA